MYQKMQLKFNVKEKSIKGKRKNAMRLWHPLRKHTTINNKKKIHTAVNLVKISFPENASMEFLQCIGLIIECIALPSRNMKVKQTVKK